MKIAYLTNFYNRRSGIARCVVELAERLSPGHQVHVFAADWEDQGRSDIHFHRIPTLAGVNSWSVRNLSIFLRGGRLLRRVHRREKFDIIHFHTPTLARCDVMTCHGLPSAGIHFLENLDPRFRGEVPARRILRYKIARPLLEYNYRPGRHRVVVGVSERIREELQRFCGLDGESIEVIPNGVDLEQFNPDTHRSQRPSIRERYGVARDEMLVIFVSHYFKRKGLPFLLEAMAKVEDPGVKLLVVGDDRRDGPAMRAQAEALGIASRVIFAGEVAEGLGAVYTAADLFAFPSFYESYGLVTLEAMACGLPVVVSDTGVAGELVDGGRNGFLVENCADSDTIAQHIVALRADPVLRQEMGKRAATFARRFTWEHNVEQYLSLYRRLLAERERA